MKEITSYSVLVEGSKGMLENSYNMTGCLLAVWMVIHSYIGLSPFPIGVTDPEPKLNLHLPLLLGIRATQHTFLKAKTWWFDRAEMSGFFFPWGETIPVFSWRFRKITWKKIRILEGNKHLEGKHLFNSLMLRAYDICHMGPLLS